MRLAKTVVMGYLGGRRLAAPLLGVFFAVSVVQAAESSVPRTMIIDGIEISDPTRPLDWRTEKKTVSTSKTVRPKLRLSSILISPARRLAIINGRSVAEGGTVDGVKVLRVVADGVQLRWKGEQWTARLPQGSSLVRTPARTQP